MEPTEQVTLTNMCMIYDDKGNVLIQDKILGEDKIIVFPGGHIDFHEPIVDSVIREIKEETGLTISNLKLCGIKDWIQEDGSRYMVFLYKTGTFSGELKSSHEGRVCWKPLSELKTMHLRWHLDKMLELFCGSGFSELFFELGDKTNETFLK